MRNQGYGSVIDGESSPLNPKTSGLAPTVAYIRRQPQDFRIGAILASAFCFFPIGMIALYFSYQVNKLYLRGDLNGAVVASGRTKFLLQVTVVLGCLIWFAGIFGILYTKG